MRLLNVRKTRASWTILPNRALQGKQWPVTDVKQWLCAQQTPLRYLSQTNVLPIGRSETSVRYKFKFQTWKKNAFESALCKLSVIIFRPESVTIMKMHTTGPTHYNDAIVGAIASLITSLTITQPFIQMQIKENIKAPRHWPLCGEFTEDRWIPRTNGQ